MPTREEQRTQKRRTYTPAQKAEALNLYETDGTRAASKQTGIPVSTIQSWANKAGIRTVRTEKAHAQVEAASIDAAKIRALVTTKTIGLADTLIDHITTQISRDGDMIPAKDLAVIFGIISDKHRALAALDRNTENNNAVDAWLTAITGQDT